MKEVNANEICFIECTDKVLVVAGNKTVPFEWGEETPELGGIVTLEEIQKQLENEYFSFMVIQESPLRGSYLQI